MSCVHHLRYTLGDSSSISCCDVVVVRISDSVDSVVVDVVADAGTDVDDEESVGDYIEVAISQESLLPVTQSPKLDVNDISVGDCTLEAISQESSEPKSELLFDDEEVTTTFLEPPVENFYDALINDELRVEEDLLRAKEAEFLAALAPPPVSEGPTILAEVPSSSELHEAPGGSSRDLAAQILPDPASTIPSPAAVDVSSSAFTPLIELTSPVLDMLPAVAREHGLQQQVTELSSAEFSAAAKKQLETQIESLEAQFKLVTDLNQELTSKLGELKDNYEAELSEKLKALQLKENEVASLNSSLDLTKAEVAAREKELKTSQMALGEEWLHTRRSDPNPSTLGLLSEEERWAEAASLAEEEEEEAFVTLVQKPNLTKTSPFSDFFGTFVQTPLVPAPISLERASLISAPEKNDIPPAFSAPLALALPPLASRSRAKRTPCRRSSSNISPSAVESPSPVLPSIPSTSFSAPLVSAFPPIASSSSSLPPVSPIPRPLFKQALGLPSQLGRPSEPSSYGLLQLQGLLAESWSLGQEQLRGLSLPHRADRHSRQAIALLASSLQIDQLLVTKD
ncbi:endochitinase A-like [Zingiber officinale]|uniref:endochitinase A-like n=1 Tax=Zingiber officinale TaxID=94328 RepID=UPI001C4C59AA|nr:endochitinase A-like [Zingiber officinale]